MYEYSIKKKKKKKLEKGSSSFQAPAVALACAPLTAAPNEVRRLILMKSGSSGWYR